MSREPADAKARGRALAERVWAEHRAVQSREPNLPAEERRVRALLASGRSEENIRVIVAKSAKISELHASLQMLTVGIAAQAERELPVGAEELMKNIIAVQRAVMDVIPSDA